MSDNKRIIVLTLILGTVCSALLAVATSLAANTTKVAPQYTFLLWAAVFVLSLITAALAVATYNLISTRSTAVDSRLTELADRERRGMLAMVRRIWIDDYLQNSLHEVARIELGKPDAVSHPWDLILQQPPRKERQLPPGQTIGTTFDEFDQVLLILGAPGSCKTTLLLELTRDLLDRAEKDPSRPIPVPFQLTTWASHQRPLADWITEELARYYVSPKLARFLVNAKHILPLLDGLDEVPAEYQSACAEAINKFREQHDFVPLAVCSRETEYRALPEQLNVSGAILIKPLTPQQINAYLDQAGDLLTGVQTALRHDEVLWKLLDTPLMLSTVILAYGGRPAAEIPKISTLEERRKHLFTTYVDRMFQRPLRRSVTRYTSEDTLRWLNWVARALIVNNLTIFRPDWIQPYLLRNRTQEWLVALSPEFFGGLLAISYLVGVVCVVGLKTTAISVFWVFWLIGLSLMPLTSDWSDLHGIFPIGKMRWSWKNLWNSWGSAVLWLIPLTFPIVSLLYDWYYHLQFSLFASFRSMLLGLAVVTIIDGTETSHDQFITTPSTEIRRALRTEFVVCLIVVGALFMAIPFVRNEVQFSTRWILPHICRSLLFGISCGVTFGGGGAYIKHHVLRALLRYNRSLPWDLFAFLEYGVDRIFLRRTGDGYAFYHRFFMENFALLFNPDAAESHWVLRERAETYRLLGRYEEALADFNRAIELKPDDAWVLTRRAKTYRLLGRYEEALADFNRAIELKPDDAWAIVSRGQTYLAQFRYEEALADFNRAIELKPDYVWAIWNRGQTYRLLDRYEEALADFNRAIELKPDDEMGLRGRAETYRLQGRYEEALADFNRAIELKPDYVWAIRSRGQTYLALSRYKEALADFHQAIKLGDDDWDYYLCGTVLLLSKRNPMARDFLERAISRAEKNYSSKLQEWQYPMNIVLYQAVLGHSYIPSFSHDAEGLGEGCVLT